MDIESLILANGYTDTQLTQTVTNINQIINQVTTKSWISGTSYIVDELVINNLNLYRCVIPNSDIVFTEVNWELIGGFGGTGTGLTPEQEILINSISSKQNNTDENLTTPIKQIVPSINYLNSTLETANSNILTKANANSVVSNSTFNSHVSSENPHNTTLNDLINMQISSLLDGQSIVWDAINSVFKNSTIGGTTDEKVKLTSVSENAEYIENLIDNVSIQISNDKLVSKSLDGMTVGIQELNYLSGLDENLMTKLANFLNGGITVYNGTFPTYTSLLAFDFTTLGIDKTYIMYVSADENHDSNGTTYLCTSLTNNTSNLPSYSGLSSASQRDLSVDKVNLATEVLGLLSQNNMDLSGIATSGDLGNYMLSSEYTDTGTTPVNIAKTLENLSSTVANIDNAVSNSHSHSNKSYIDKIGEDVLGNPTYNGNPIGNGATSEDTMLMSVYDPNSDGSVLMADKLASELTAPNGTQYYKNNSGVVGWFEPPIAVSTSTSIRQLEFNNLTTNVPETQDFFQHYQILKHKYNVGN